MFECKRCPEKDKHIEFLEKQNKDLYDRLMAFNKDAFVHYKAESRVGEPLFPIGLDKDGKSFSYKSTDPTKTNEEVYRAMGEEPINVEEPMEKPMEEVKK